MAKKTKNDDLLSMFDEALQSSIPTMNKDKRQKVSEVLQMMMPGLFDSLPEKERGTKAKVVKMSPRKAKPKVMLKKTAKTRTGKKDYLSDIEPRKMLLKITLDRVKPIVWRKIEVPSNISLEHLHTIIQQVFGWSDEHLHEFLVGDDNIAPTGRGYSFETDYNAWLVALDEVLPSVGSTFKYLYDFGDQWLHIIKLEAVTEYAETETPTERLIATKGNGPEDA